MITAIDLNIDGIVNLRQLGGIENIHGKSVRKNVLYRSACVVPDGADAIQAVEALELKTIFDLRSTGERMAMPDYVPHNCQYLTCPLLPELPNAPKAQQASLDMKSIVEALASNPGDMLKGEGYLSSLYRKMMKDTKNIRQIFAVLLGEEGAPALFHCTAGKDRTGVVAAYILRLLEVPMESIQKNYLLSNDYRKSDNDQTIAALRQKIQDERQIQIATDMLMVKSEYLDNSFDEIDLQFGSFEGFAAEGLGLSAQDVADFRQLYLAN